ncbi:MAG: hypothetical protein HKN29_05935 [Rhodothermales bacterium]|nr:hypothetical protein [Rhodothermales bacterium]
MTIQDAVAQDAGIWVKRWVVEQREASVTVAGLHFEETGVYALDGAFGARSLDVDSRVHVELANPEIRRRVTRVLTEDGEVREGESEGRRRLRNPVRRDLLGSADRLLFPAQLLESQEPRGPVEPERLGGQDVFRLVTVAASPDDAVESVVWHFARPSGRLVQARAIVRGEGRGTLVVDMKYGRQEGLDLPVERTIEGSFEVRRRTRTFTVLVDSRSTITLAAIDAL